MRSSTLRHRAPRVVRVRSGFTLVEMLIAMLLGVVVLSAATGFALQTWQTRRGSGIRDVVDRNGRYIGMTVILLMRLAAMRWHWRLPTFQSRAS